MNISEKVRNRAQTLISIYKTLKATYHFRGWKTTPNRGMRESNLLLFANLPTSTRSLPLASLTNHEWSAVSRQATAIFRLRLRVEAELVYPSPFRRQTDIGFMSPEPGSAALSGHGVQWGAYPCHGAPWMFAISFSWHALTLPCSTAQKILACRAQIVL